MKLKLIGAKKIKAKLVIMEKTFKKKVNTQVVGAAMRTSTMAKLRLQPLPDDDAEMAADIAAVRQSINFTADPQKMTSTVYAGNVAEDNLAAYLEFGTGKYAQRQVAGLPEDLQRLAMTFYVNGRGTLKAHPYLVNSYLQEGRRLKKKLEGLKLGSQNS